MEIALAGASAPSPDCKEELTLGCRREATQINRRQPPGTGLKKYIDIVRSDSTQEFERLNDLVQSQRYIDEL